MTIEQRMVIEPRDIVSVEVECPKCKTRIIRGFSGENDVPMQCANRHCQHSFFMDIGDDRPENLRRALNILWGYTQSENNRPFALRFEVRQ
jgi:hypothetical protein